MKPNTKHSVESFNLKNKKILADIIVKLFDVQPEYRKELTKTLVWLATQWGDDARNLKYKGQPYWSINALNKYFENLQNKDVKNKFQDLRHEHAVPKEVIIQKINILLDECNVSGTRPKASHIFDMLDTFGHAVVVTKQEDKHFTNNDLQFQMPNGQLNHDKTVENVFARYIKVGIKICDVRSHTLDRNITSQQIAELAKHALT